MTDTRYVKGDDVKVAQTPRQAVELEFNGYRAEAAESDVEDVTDEATDDVVDDEPSALDQVTPDVDNDEPSYRY